jgi:hypothetical protein
MNKYYLLVILFCAGFLSACGSDEKTQQVIIPKAQLDVLDKAKGIEDQLLKNKQLQDEKFQQQGL